MWQGALKLWSSSSTLPNTSFGCYDITVWESHHSSIGLIVWPKNFNLHISIYIYVEVCSCHTRACYVLVYVLVLFAEQRKAGIYC